jgi:hypothetical protein
MLSIGSQGFSIIENNYVSGLETECDRYAHGTELTQEGGYFFVCNLITRVGPTLLAAAIGGGAGGLAASGVGGFLAELC